MKTTRLFLLVSTSAAILVLRSLGAGDAACCSPCCDGRNATTTSAATAAPLPDESLYHLAATWQDQDGKSVTLADFAGTPVIVTMVFSHCTYACPRIVADLKHIRATLPAELRDQVRFVLASFDTDRDTPARLHEWAAEQDLGAGWTLLHGDTDAVRELSVLLDIAYLRQPDGSFGHANRIVLLDRHGVPAAGVEGLGAQPGMIVDAATAMLHNP